MKSSEVKLGNVYTAKVSDRVVQVRIDSKHSKQGWNATNTATGRKVHIKSPQRLRREVKVATKPVPTAVAKAAAEVNKTEQVAKKVTTLVKAAQPGKRMSALDAAAKVLQQAGTPMNSKDLITAMAKADLWSSPNGRTPHATLYSAILREIQKQGTKARFKKIERGQFAYNG